jgi:predicted Zn-dependent protease
MLCLYCFITSLLLTRRSAAQGDRRQQGQATAEYALVLLGAAAVAIVFAAWAARSGKIGQLFDKVFDLLLDRAG